MGCVVHDTVNAWGAPLPEGLVRMAVQACQEVRSAVCPSLGVDGSAWEVRLAGSFLNGTATVCSSDVDIHVVRVDRYSYEFPEQPMVRAWIREWLGNSLACEFIELRRRIEEIVRGYFGTGATPRPKSMHIAGSPWRLEADVVVGIVHRFYTGAADASGQPEYIAGVELRSREDPLGRLVCYPCLRHQEIERHDCASGRRSRSLMRILKCVRHAMQSSGVPALMAAAADIPSCLIEGLLAAVPPQLYHGTGGCFWSELHRVLPHAIELVGSPETARGLRDLGGMQPLFGPDRRWSREGALQFLRVAWTQLHTHSLPVAR